MFENVARISQSENVSSFQCFNSSEEVSTNSEVWHDNWLIAVKTWIATLSIFGGIGNFITVATIFHQMVLHRKSKSRIITEKRRTYEALSLRRRSQKTSSTNVNSSVSLQSPCQRARYYCPQQGQLNRTVVMKVQADTILLLHLIFCDFLYCAINLPHTFYVYGFKYRDEPPVLCASAAFFRYVSAFAEWTTLGLLTVQRCIDLTKPPNARFFRVKSTLVSISAIWVISILLQIQNVVNVRYGYDVERHKCDILGSKMSKLYFFMIDSILPCGLMLFGCFSIIFQIIRNKRRLQKLGVSPEVVAERAKKMWKSATLMLGLLLIFLMCVIPLCIFNVLFVLGIIDSLEGEIVVYMIYWIEYVINFLVYAARKSKYRRAYKDFFREVFHIHWCVQKTRHCTTPRNILFKLKSSNRSTAKPVECVVQNKDCVHLERNYDDNRCSSVVQLQGAAEVPPPDLLIGHQL